MLLLGMSVVCYLAKKQDQSKSIMDLTSACSRNSDPLGTPRGRYDEHGSKFSLSKKPRFNQTSRRRESLLKVLLAD